MRATWKAIAVAAAFVASATMLACTLLVSTDETQCATADDCHARGPAFASAVCVASVCVSPEGGAADAGTDDPWGCLSQPSIGSDPSASLGMPIVMYNAFSSFTFAGARDGGSDLALVEYTPQTNVTIAACSVLDLGCATPNSGPTLTNDAGVAVMTVPGSFTGFYSLSAPGGVPSLFYTGRILPGDSLIGYPTSEIAQTSYTAIQGSLGIPANENTDAGPGVLSVTQFDCNDHHAAGVTFTSDPAPGETVYLANGLPSQTEKATTPDGSGILVNVPAGSVLVTTSLPAQGNRTIGTAEVAVKPGGITLLYLRARSH